MRTTKPEVKTYFVVVTVVVIPKESVDVVVPLVVLDPVLEVALEVVLDELLAAEVALVVEPLDVEELEGIEELTAALDGAEPLAVEAGELGVMTEELGETIEIAVGLIAPREAAGVI